MDDFTTRGFDCISLCKDDFHFSVKLLYMIHKQSGKEVENDEACFLKMVPLLLLGRFGVSHLVCVLGASCNCVTEISSENEGLRMNKRRYKNAWVFYTLKAERTRRGDFAKLMITGTSKTGGFESGTNKDGQTCEHALVAFTLGLEQMSFCFNKDLKRGYFASSSTDMYHTVAVGVIKSVGKKDPTRDEVTKLAAKDNCVTKRRYENAWVLDTLKAETARRGNFAKLITTGTSRADCDAPIDYLNARGVGGKDAPVLHSHITGKFGEFLGNMQSRKDLEKIGEACVRKMVPYSQYRLLGHFSVSAMMRQIVGVSDQVYELNGSGDCVIESSDKETVRMNKRRYENARALNTLKAERARRGDFAKLMITGTFTTGSFESSTSKQGLTRGYALDAFTLGFKQMLFYFNKDFKRGYFASSSTDMYHTVAVGIIKSVGKKDPTRAKVTKLVVKDNFVIESSEKETVRVSKWRYENAWALDTLKAERARCGNFTKLMTTGTSKQGLTREHALDAFPLGFKQMLFYFSKDLKRRYFASSSTDMYHTVAVGVIKSVGKKDPTGAKVTKPAAKKK